MTPPINRLRFLFAIKVRRSVLAIHRMRRLLALNRLPSRLLAMSGIRGLLRWLDSCGVRVSKSGISSSSIRPSFALHARIGAEVDDYVMNTVNQPPAAGMPKRLLSPVASYSPFHLVEVIVEVRC